MAITVIMMIMTIAAVIVIVIASVFAMVIVVALVMSRMGSPFGFFDVGVSVCHLY